MPPKMKSIADLRRELAARQRELKKLKTRRAKLVARLETLDKRIAGIDGQASTSSPGPRRKAKAARRPRKAGGDTLMEHIRKVLAASREPMRVKDVVKAVRKAGYKTASKDFYGNVAATIRDPKTFKRVSRGVYTLAK